MTVESTNIGNTGTVLSCWARVAVDALRAQGIDPQPALAAAGFTADAFHDPNARHPIGATTQLWRLAARCSGEPAFGLAITRHVASTSLHALGYAILASATIEEALQRAVRHGELIVEPGTLLLEQRDGTAALGIRPCAPPTALGFELRDALLSALVRMLRHATEGAFTLSHAELQRPGHDLSPYQRFFRCPVAVGPHDMLFFDRALLAMPLGSANAELARANDGAVQQYLRGRRRPGVVARVRAAILEHLSTIVSPERVASRLGLSLRSMQRSLHACGTSYEELLREVRVELACRYLREGGRTMSEVAFALGYDNPSAFSRAFRRWTGVAPSEYARHPSA
jgi:AraC-like DNA-binding protein